MRPRYRSRSALRPRRGSVACGVLLPPTASDLPSGLNAKPINNASVAGIGAPTGRRVPTSHNRTVWSSEPEAIRVPSGLTATAVTSASCPVSGEPHRHSRDRIPHPHGLVVTAGNQACPVRSERQADDVIGVCLGQWSDRRGRHRRDADRLAPSCGQPVGAGTQRDLVDGFGKTGGYFPGLGVDDPCWSPAMSPNLVSWLPKATHDGTSSRLNILPTC